MRLSRSGTPSSLSAKTVLYSLVFLLASSCVHPVTTPDKTPTESKRPTIDHVVVIYLENHSFFNLFAEFPGADQTLPPEYAGQRDLNGVLYKALPPVPDRAIVEKAKLAKPFPRDLPNKPFVINNYFDLSVKSPDPNHEFYTHQREINGGKLDRFVALSGVGALAYGYYDIKTTHLWRYAREYTLADRFFQSSFGGSFVNHQWLISARTPRYPDAPNAIKVVLDENGTAIKKGSLTPDGFVVNTIQPREFPYDPKISAADKRLPPLDDATIGDLLSEKKISWAWYAGGWNKVISGKKVETFQYHHQPFLYYRKYGPGTTARKEHLRDGDELLSDLRNGQLPSVVFFKPYGPENAHPYYSDITAGDAKVHEVVEAVKSSPYWQRTLIVVTFDEHGGFWDPIAPPVIDRWGPGSRIPAVFISPHVRERHVDHTPYETVSILAFLEKRFDLKPLSERDAKASPLTGIFKD